MSIMQVSRKVDYALRAAIYLAYQSDRQPCSVAEIAAHEAIPKKFLEKIIQDLIREYKETTHNSNRSSIINDH